MEQLMCVLCSESLLLLIVLQYRTCTFHINILISQTEHAVSTREAGISEIAWLFTLITFWLESWSQTNSFCKHYWSFMYSTLHESVEDSQMGASSKVHMNISVSL